MAVLSSDWQIEKFFRALTETPGHDRNIRDNPRKGHSCLIGVNTQADILFLEISENG